MSTKCHPKRGHLVDKSVHEMSPLLSTRCHLLCPRDVCHPRSFVQFCLTLQDESNKTNTNEVSFEAWYEALLTRSVSFSHDRKSEITREVFFTKAQPILHDLKIHMYLCSVGKAWKSLIHPKEMVGMKLCLKNSYNPPAPTNFFL